MDKLPRELLRELLQYLPRSDLPSVRLLTRTLAVEAEPFLFHTIPLWIELKSLEALTGVSEHPRLSQYVQEITFSPIRFIEHEDRSLYQAGVRDSLEYETASLSSHILRLGHHMAAYDSFRAGQHYLAAKSSDVKVLSHAFGKLPQFKSLVVDYFSMIAATRLYKAFGGYDPKKYKPGLVARDGEYSLPVLFKALANSKVAISTFRIGNSQAYELDLDTYLNRLESLQISPVFYGKRTISLALWKTFTRIDEHHFRETLRDLRTFEVDERQTDGVGRDDIDQLMTGIGTILRWGSNIESIVLPSIGADASDDLPMPSMVGLFPNYGLNKLQKLKLESFTTTLSYFTVFFHRQGKRLKEIEFDYVTISDAEWSTALLRLRAMKFPDLVTFYVDFVNACDYITGKTDVNPFTD